MAGEGLPQAATDGREQSRTLISQGETEVIVSPIETTGSVAIRFWDGDAIAVFIGWSEDVTQVNGFPMEQGEFLTLDIDTSAQQIYALAVGGEADMRVIATN